MFEHLTNESSYTSILETSIEINKQKNCLDYLYDFFYW